MLESLLSLGILSTFLTLFDRAAALQRSFPSLGKDVEHEIDQDAGHRDIHPHGEDPSCDFRVTPEIFFIGVIDRRENERDHQGRQRRVCQQDGEIGCPGESGPLVTGDAGNEKMVGQIGDQK